MPPMAFLPPLTCQTRVACELIDSGEAVACDVYVSAQCRRLFGPKSTRRCINGEHTRDVACMTSGAGY
jgi:hypothetical protein